MTYLKADKKESLKKAIFNALQGKVNLNSITIIDNGYAITKGEVKMTPKQYKGYQKWFQKNSETIIDGVTYKKELKFNNGLLKCGEIFIFLHEGGNKNISDRYEKSIRNIKGLQPAKSEIVAIRWLGAFRGNGYNWQDMAKWELDPQQPVSAEGIGDNGSLIKHPAIGLLADNSCIVKAYLGDAYTVMENGKYIPKRNYSITDTRNSDPKYLRAFANLTRKKWNLAEAGKWVELILENPKYKAVVVRTSAPKALEQARIMAEIMGLPIVKAQDLKKILRDYKLGVI